ncbi:MAG: bacterioferritin [Rickettsiales bacterium]|jgi:bacterioferritin
MSVKIIDQLNIILGNELVTINQYLIHAKILRDLGFNKIASLTKAESIDKINNADVIIDRILFLDGTPNMNNYKKIHVGKTVVKMFDNDLAINVSTIADLRIAIKTFFDVGDTGRKYLLETFLISEEEYLDFLHTIRISQKFGNSELFNYPSLESKNI